MPCLPVGFALQVDVGLAADALLPVVGLGAEQVGAINVSDVLGFQVGFEDRAQVADLRPLAG